MIYTRNDEIKGAIKFGVAAVYMGWKKVSLLLFACPYTCLIFMHGGIRHRAGAIPLQCRLCTAAMRIVWGNPHASLEAVVLGGLPTGNRGVEVTLEIRSTCTEPEIQYGIRRLGQERKTHARWWSQWFLRGQTNSGHPSDAVRKGALRSMQRRDQILTSVLNMHKPYVSRSDVECRGTKRRILQG